MKKFKDFSRTTFTIFKYHWSNAKLHYYQQICISPSGPEVLFQDLRRDEIRGWWWWSVWLKTDLDSTVLIQDQDRDSRLTSHGLTGSRWLGWTVTNKKTEIVMASRKSSIPLVAHSKQQNIIPCLTTVLFRQLPLIIAVYQNFGAYTQHFKSTMFDWHLKH